MKKIVLEIAGSLVLVFGAALLVAPTLSDSAPLWNSQSFWSMTLATGWVVVAGGYYHQGWLVRQRKRSDGVSIVLPSVVFIVQCILFVKGIFYNDWSLIWGALVVNSGVLFSLFQIFRVRR